MSSIAELTTLEDKPIKILDTGQRDKERDKDNRDREREWNYKNISQNHISNNHQSGAVANHTSHVSTLSAQFIVQLDFFFVNTINL